MVDSEKNKQTQKNPKNHKPKNENENKLILSTGW